MTTADFLRSRMTGNCQVRFWRAVEGVIPSLTLILVGLVQSEVTPVEWKTLRSHVETGIETSNLLVRFV